MTPVGGGKIEISASNRAKLSLNKCFFLIFFFQFFYVSVLKIESYLLKNILYRPEFDHRGWLICECVYKHRYLIPKSGLHADCTGTVSSGGGPLRHAVYALNKRLLLRRVSDCLVSGVAD